MPKYDVIFDSNEAWQHASVINELKKDKYSVGVQKLSSGDLYFEGPKRGLLTEHKTSRDFARSLLDERLWDQLKRLKMQKERLGCDIMLLIEGSWYQVVKSTKWNRASIIGIIDSIRDPDGWNIEILGPFPSRLWTTMWIKSRVKRNKKISSKTLYALRRKLPETKTMAEKQRYILEGLPGIGPTSADTLLKDFGTVQNVFKNIDKINKSKRIGTKVRDKAVEIICGTYTKKT